MKRTGAILLCMVLLIAPILAVPHKAAAVAPAAAVPLGIEIGAGAYTLAALGVAAVASGLGYSEYSEEVNAHAAAVWTGAQETVNGMIRFAMGDSLAEVPATSPTMYTAPISVAIPEAYVPAIKSNWQPILYSAAPTISMPTSGGRIDPAKYYVEANYMYNDPTQPLNRVWMHAYYGNGMVIRGGQLPVSTSVEVLNMWGSIVIRDYHSGRDLAVGGSYADLLDAAKTKNVQKMYDFLYRALGPIPLVQTNVADYNKINTTMADPTPYVPVISGKQKIVIPGIEHFKPYAKLAGNVPDLAQPLTWVAAEGVYKTAAGTIVAPGDVAWDFPKPKIYTDASGKKKVGFLDPTTGQMVPIDEPVTAPGEVPIPTNPPIDYGLEIGRINTRVGSLEQTVAQVQAETASISSTLTEVTAVPSATDWSGKMRTLVTTKFPFSLPWDFYRLLSLVNADPQRPDVYFEKSFAGMPFKLDVKFAWLDPYMPFFRGFIVIAFCISLVMSTRKLMGGST